MAQRDAGAVGLILMFRLLNRVHIINLKCVSDESSVDCENEHSERSFKFEENLVKISKKRYH